MNERKIEHIKSFDELADKYSVLEDEIIKKYGSQYGNCFLDYPDGVLREKINQLNRKFLEELQELQKLQSK
ncbi:MAG: hypothetical protein ACOYH4_03420 [Saccharofermentanales bacterium]|jgi:hypothetical protein